MLALNDQTGEPPENTRDPEPRVLPIVRDVLAGNREAFDEIVFLYSDQVYATAWQLTRNADDAMDVTQEVFLRVFRALGSFKGTARFSTWLHRIVLNTCVDFVRREKRHRQGRVDPDEREEDGEQDRDLDRSTPGTQRETAQFHELQASVVGALGKLSAKQRQVFLLRYYNELSLKEIAEVLRCSVGAIKRHLYRAQVRLSELLKDIRPNGG
jgi:RNA polymerase sigma-70 factor (ECF subfamily)